MATSQAGAVFLDRDGVLNEEAGDYITRPEDLRLLPGAADAVARLSAAGFPVFIFTNQAGVGRGRMTLETLEAIHVSLESGLSASGGRLSGLYACTHHPDAGCECRKPRPGMLLQAARDHGIDLHASYVVGDSPRDIAAGHAAGCTTILVLTGHTRAFAPSEFPEPHPDHVFPDLPAAARWLCEQLG